MIGVCLVLGTVLAFSLQSTFAKDLPETQDVVIGLLYYMEEHGGQFPASEKEFLASSFVEPDPAGGFRVRPKQPTQFRQQTNGVLIRDLAPFRIAWGADLAHLRINEYGRVLDANGNPVELVRWPNSPTSAKDYSSWLVSIHRALHKLDAQPSPP